MIWQSKYLFFQKDFYSRIENVPTLLSLREQNLCSKCINLCTQFCIYFNQKFILRFSKTVLFLSFWKCDLRHSQGSKDAKFLSHMNKFRLKRLLRVKLHIIFLKKGFRNLYFQQRVSQAHNKPFSIKRPLKVERKLSSQQALAVTRVTTKLLKLSKFGISYTFWFGASRLCYEKNRGILYEGVWAKQTYIELK